MQQRDQPRQPAMQHSYQRSADSTRSNASANLLVPSHIRTPSSEQFPNGVPLITRNAGGYFDTSNVQSRSFSPAATPRTSTDQPMTPASTASSFQQTKEKSSFRRGSISSMFKSSHNRGDSSTSFLKRRDSHTSSTTKTSGMRGRTFSFSRRDSSASPAEGSRMRSNSRRGSIKEALRRASNDVSKGVKVVKMGPSERDKYVQKEKDKILREIEEARRKAPNTRPKYQQDYISERQRQSIESRASASSKPLGELSAADQILALERALQNQDEDALADAEVNPEKMAVEEMEDCERCGRPVTTALKDGLCERCYRIRLKGVEGRS